MSSRRRHLKKGDRIRIFSILRIDNGMKDRKKCWHSIRPGRRKKKAGKGSQGDSKVEDYLALMGSREI